MFIKNQKSQSKVLLSEIPPVLDPQLGYLQAPSGLAT